MSIELENKIRDTLKDVKPWQRVPTSVEGVFLVKTPANDNRETIMVEINPLNEWNSKYDTFWALLTYKINIFHIFHIFNLLV